MKRMIRFMSEEELSKYLDGQLLENHTKFEQNGSEGFCFFDAEDIDPITAQHVLSGISEMEFMVEFYVEERTVEKMKKAYGTYHLPGKPMFEATKLPEYSITEYNRRDFYPWQIWRLYIKMPVHTEKDGTIVVDLPKRRKAYE